VCISDVLALNSEVLTPPFADTAEQHPNTRQEALLVENRAERPRGVQRVWGQSGCGEADHLLLQRISQPGFSAALILPVSALFAGRRRTHGLPEIGRSRPL
jgi:hypothetical protein